MSVLDLGPRRLRRLFRFYLPYVGAGIRVTHIADDWRRIDVEMKLRRFNRNAVGTHFGGSLYSMVDPHLMLMVMRCLGSDYVVWDRWASIDFLKPGRGTVRASVSIDDAFLDDIRTYTAGGDKYLPELEVTITDDQGDPVAVVRKRLHVRRKG